MVHLDEVITTAITPIEAHGRTVRRNGVVAAGSRRLQLTHSASPEEENTTLVSLEEENTILVLLEEALAHFNTNNDESEDDCIIIGWGDKKVWSYSVY